MVKQSFDFKNKRAKQLIERLFWNHGENRRAGIFSAQERCLPYGKMLFSDHPKARRANNLDDGTD
jgi:hypothetical protein